MNDSQLLSAFQELGREPPRQAAPRRAPVFDACQLGVVLRAVLFVEAVMAVVAMFGAADVLAWSGRVALLSGAALPGVLGWLVVTCSCKRLLARLPELAQQAIAVALGAVSGVYGCALLALLGSFPRVLGRYVRERKALSLEQAITKMTALPASRVHLKDRGRLAPAMAADVVVFDPATIADRATYEDPFQYPVGIDAVIVNGAVALRDGQRDETRSGKPLRA